MIDLHNLMNWKDNALTIGNLYVGEVIHFRTHEKRRETPFRSWIMTKDGDGEEVGWYATNDKARSALEEAVLKALRIST